MLSDHYVCVATCCNRQDAEVLGVVPPENLIAFLAQCNAGHLLVEIEDDEKNSLNMRMFKFEHLTHTFAYPCVPECTPVKQIYCVQKGD